VLLFAIIIVAILIIQNSLVQRTAIGTIVPAPNISWPNPNGKTLGSVNAKVVVLEFADFQCPYCKVFHDTILPQIINQYVSTGKVRFEFHHYIVVDRNIGGTESQDTAEASECANHQGKFWEYFNLAFANQGLEGSGAFSSSRLKAFAANIGLDTYEFNNCITSHQFIQQVPADVSLALSLKLNSTPSMLINNILVENPMDLPKVRAAIDAALQNAG